MGKAVFTTYWIAEADWASKERSIRNECFGFIPRFGWIDDKARHLTGAILSNTLAKEIRSSPPFKTILPRYLIPCTLIQFERVRKGRRTLRTPGGDACANRGTLS
jgi:hypothetical protein